MTHPIYLITALSFLFRSFRVSYPCLRMHFVQILNIVFPLVRIIEHGTRCSHQINTIPRIQDH